MQNALRIALIIETSGGGSGRHVLDLVRGFAQRGNDVTVIWSPTRAQADFAAELSGIQNITTHKLPMSRSVGLSDISSLRAMAKLLSGLRPFDILHAHSSKAGALVRLLPKSIQGARIYTPHAFRTMDPDLGGLSRSIYSRIELALAPRCDKIIVVSGSERDHAVSIGINASKLAVVVNGASLPQTTRADARAQMGLTDRDIAVGFIGRLAAQKDPLRFVAAVSHGATLAPNLRGIVIGDGPLRADAQRNDTTQSQSINFVGWQDGPRLIQGLDIFCMTSLYEAMPYTLIEALHARIPIVTTAIGGAPEAVVDGENGFILPIDSTPIDIGKSLATLAQDHAMRSRFGEASLRRAATRTLNMMVDETLAVYASVI